MDISATPAFGFNVPTCGMLTAKSVSCGSYGTPEECCTFFGEVSWFCLAVCVLCCTECKIQLETGDCDVPTQSPTTKVAATPPDYTLGQIPGANALSFTTSAYGIMLPLVFGSDKLTGNVIWSSDPELFSYVQNDSIVQYWRVNFALAICEGSINNILRLWIGERLIVDNTVTVDANNVVTPGADGFILGTQIDLTTEDSPLRTLSSDDRSTRITVFDGTEYQIPLGIMRSYEGVGLTPGYRGTAYVLFENFLIIDGAIPNIFVEVSANTSDLTPRLYGTFPGTQVIHDQFSNVAPVMLDRSYGYLYVGAEDNSGSGPVPGSEGFMVYRNNTLEIVRELDATVNSGFDGSFLAYRASVLYNGNMVLYRPSGNFGVMQTYNTITGKVDDLLGPGGSLTAHSLTTGFAALSAACCTFVAIGSDGIPKDIFCGYGQVNKSYGFMEIDENNQMSMIGVSNLWSASAYWTNAACVSFQPLDSFVVANPTFMDGVTPTDGTHVIYFHGLQSENTEIIVNVVSYDSIGVGAIPTAPVTTTIGTIDLASVAGTGIATDLLFAFRDESDGTVIIGFTTATTGLLDRIIKFNPFTGQVVWSTAVRLWNGSVQGFDPPAHCNGGLYAWVANTSPQTVWTIDLEDGTPEEVISDLTSELLDQAQLTTQYFNSDENSITYISFSPTAGQELTKIFINRVSRQEVLVSDIVANLLQRVGFDYSDIDIDNITALSLTGYTVKTVSSLRSIFAELATVFRFDIIESEGAIKYKTRGAASVDTIPEKYLADIDQNGWLKETQDNDFTRRRKINLTYRDLEREYGNNVQSYILPRYTNEKFDADAYIDVTVPVVLIPDDAKRLAEILLYSKIIYESSYQLKLPARYLKLEPGDVVDLTMSDQTVTCRIRETSLSADNTIEVTAVKEDQDIYTDIIELSGDVGRFDPSTLGQVDARIDMTFMSIPFIDYTTVSGLSNAYAYFIVLLNRDGNTPFLGNIFAYVDGNKISVTPPASYPTWGYVTTPLTNTTAFWSTDYTSVLTVDIVSTTGLSLASAASKDALTNNSYMNLALVGGELIQFETATNTSGSTWELTNIVRCKFGSESQSLNHPPGEKFILIGDSTGVLDTNILQINTELGDSPRKSIQIFLDTNNPFQPAPSKIGLALNHRPWAPSDCTGIWTGTGTNDAQLDWERRSRWNGEWEDDLIEYVPLNVLTESYELYLFKDPTTLNLTDPVTYLRKEEVITNTYTYAYADQTADGFDNTTEDLYCLVYQTGSVTGQDKGGGTMFRLEYKR
jgi:hypothetical protein